jgi:hypothetical protein
MRESLGKQELLLIPSRPVTKLARQARPMSSRLVTKLTRQARVTPYVEPPSDKALEELLPMSNRQSVKLVHPSQVSMAREREATDLFLG